jgi:hypothetical protein
MISAPQVKRCPVDSSERRAFFNKNTNYEVLQSIRME